MRPARVKGMTREQYEMRIMTRRMKARRRVIVFGKKRRRP